MAGRLLARLALPGSLALLGTGYMWATLSLPLPPFGGPVTARAFPILLGIGLFIAVLLLFLERGAPAASPDAEADEPSGIRPLPAALAGWMLLYIAALEPAGFILATSVFLAGLMLVFHRQRPVQAIAVAIGFSIVIYLLFVKVLGVSLPSGLLFGGPAA